jgi:hypothetical protein
MNYRSSTSPIEDIAKITYEGQEEWRRMYQSGYEGYFNSLMKIEDNVHRDIVIEHNQATMHSLARQLKEDSFDKAWILSSQRLADEKSFVRTILGLESPVLANGEYRAGNEIVTGTWKKGMEIPVHGHAQGFMHEEMIYGKMLVSYYRRMYGTRLVRQVKAEVLEGNQIINTAYNTPDGTGDYNAIIHKFKALDDSLTLHHFPSHTRDARGVTFDVEWFEDAYHLAGVEMQQISTRDGMGLRRGDVIAVRSENASEYGDHYIIAHGHNEMRNVGLRPKVSIITAKNGHNKILNGKEYMNGAILLKLPEALRQSFLTFHDIRFEGDRIVLPKI